MSADLQDYVFVSYSDIRGKSLEELKKINGASCIGLDNLLSGLRAVGSLMTWAVINEHYSEKCPELMARDMNGIGDMLQSLAGIIEGLNTTSYLARGAMAEKEAEQ